MKATLLHTSAHQLAGIPDGHIHVIATSPPFFGLRQYDGNQAIEWPPVAYSPMPGLPPIQVPGCDPECSHEWGGDVPPLKPGQVEQTKNPRAGVGAAKAGTRGNFCQKCGGWRGGLGTEPTLEAYVGHLILCLRAFWRVLRPDGTLWLNLGDSFAGSGVAGPISQANTLNSGSGPGQKYSAYALGRAPTPEGLKPKDLMLAPARVALAAQADGWYVRAAPPWVKPNGKPGPWKDRPIVSHENIYLFSKGPRYFYDQTAVQLPALEGGQRNRRTGDWWYESLDHLIEITQTYLQQLKGVQQNGGLLAAPDGQPLGFSVPTRPYTGAHFAAWPEDLVEPMLKASTSAKGCCSTCGAPWRRVTKKQVLGQARPYSNGDGRHPRREVNPGQMDASDKTTLNFITETQTTGWKPGCSCQAGSPVPCRVLDPFNGSGTTGRVALRLGLEYYGCDISQMYLEELTPERTTVQPFLPLFGWAG